MLLIIPEVVDQAQLNEITSRLKEGNFVDGRFSAGKSARRVKNNEELQANPREMEHLNKLVMGPLVQNATFQAATMPYRVASPYYARYTAGMRYGDHVDDPVMGPPGGQYRSDISTTVFLNDSDCYQGGELVIRTSYGEQQVKLRAGDAVTYPSSSLHRVNEITSGERLVAVTWTQSMIRDPQQRELLFQLYQTRESLLDKQAGSDDATRLDHAYVNLMRMWSEL